MNHQLVSAVSKFAAAVRFALCLLACALAVAPCARADLFVASYNDSTVKRYDQNTGTYLGDFFTSGSGGLSGTASLIFDRDEHLYVAGQNNTQVLRYNGTDGSPIDAFTAPSSVNTPYGILQGFDNNFYVNSDPSYVSRICRSFIRP